MNSNISRPISTNTTEDNLKEDSSSTLQRSRNDGVVPDFIQKLFNMLENAGPDSCFHWGRQGTTFVIDYPNEFAKTILPKRFKHSNFSSFVRQLNKYDFHKLRFLDNRTSPIQSQAWEFQHPNFRRDKKHLLSLIRRKTNRKTNVKNVNNDKNKASSSISSPSSTSASTFSVEVSDHQQHMSPSSSLEASSENMNQLKDILNGFQTQLNDLRNAQVNMESTVNKLLHRDTLLLDQLNDLRRNLDERNAILSTLIDNKRFIQSTLQNINIKDEISPTIPSPQSPSLKLFPWIQLPTLSNTNNTNTNNTNTILPSSSRIITNTIVSSSPISTSLSNNSTSSTNSVSSSSTTNTTNTTTNTTNNHHIHTNNNNSNNNNNNTNEIKMEKNNNESNDNNSNNNPIETPIIKINDQNQQPTCLLWNIKPKILVVEDNELYRKISERCLNRLGCNFDMACDGLEAISFMESNKYDLILMDISIPKLDGMEVTRKLRTYDQLTPVVSMTANYTEHDIDNYVGSGMTDLLPKPFDQSKLYDILKQHCSHLI
ncbi:unnamed protein product [Cunninghamella blakesleeana]